MNSTFPKIDVLGVGISSLCTEQLIQTALARAESRTASTILYANVHVLNTAWRDEHLRNTLNRADVVYCDGAGVRFGARLLGRYLPERMTGADWIEPLCAACAACNVSLFLIGGEPDIAAQAASILSARHAGLRITGSHQGYLSETSVSLAAIGEVNRTRPDILLVGMGTPAQERWIAEHRAELQTPVVWSVGALFDFVVGVEPRGPRWVMDHGMEWVCRLYAKPGRLWKRYLLGNPLFIFRILGQKYAMRQRR